ncbi:hypothetical protein COHA_002389 [Chlorella ohadii]|uniref:MPN domain-containing protein n=1 Tax=Chlorella ohadii TaxID=2649997 RepID=A0AAD5E0L7_9CHLO|nr:hypothetical protein COHA_002389 [Chlorella ohadii]
MKSCTLSEDALLKVLLHAAKHPTTAVNGVLLGTVSGGDGAAEVSVTDAVPACHSFISLAPVLEAALSQLEAHAKEQQGTQSGLRIVGYYQANERLSDGELGAGRRFADRIEAAWPHSVALLLDGPALQAGLAQLTAAEGQAGGSGGSEQPVAQLFAKDGGRWTKVAAGGSGGFRCPTSGVVSRFAQLLGEGRHQQLHDFEEHLDDIALDWLNPTLLAGPA